MADINPNAAIRRLHNQGFLFKRPALLASTAMGEDIPESGLPEFASKRMVYVEACPYASRRFSLSREQMARLAQEDIGFIIARQVTELLLAAEPAMVFVNGYATFGHLEKAWRGRLSWGEWQKYASRYNPRAEPDTLPR